MRLIVVGGTSLVSSRALTILSEGMILTGLVCAASVAVSTFLMFVSTTATGAYKHKFEFEIQCVFEREPIEILLSNR